MLVNDGSGHFRGSVAGVFSVILSSVSVAAFRLRHRLSQSVCRTAFADRASSDAIATDTRTGHRATDDARAHGRPDSSADADAADAGTHARADAAPEGLRGGTTLAPSR